ncbi:MAG: methyltransferase [Pseudomonadota bacterium]
MRSLPLLFCVSVCLCFPVLSHAALDWETALDGDHRTGTNSDRDVFRHPKETLEFFGLKEDMTVVELAPGGGWYTEILAPLLRERGVYYAAHYDANGRSYYRRSLGTYLQKLGENDELYRSVKVTSLAPLDSMQVAPPESADLVLAFRNIHSWMRSDTLSETFNAAYAALKTGGVFGIVQHRAKDERSEEQMKATGYVTEQSVIAAAKAAGFVLDARSEVNANPVDSADYEGGVWELPPALRGDERTRAARLATGESDRMTLRFKKGS